MLVITQVIHSSKTQPVGTDLDLLHNNSKCIYSISKKKNLCHQYCLNSFCLNYSQCTCFRGASEDGGHKINLVVVRFLTKQNSIWSNALIIMKL